MCFKVFSSYHQREEETMLLKKFWGKDCQCTPLLLSYHHHKKNEIECQVNEIMDARIIRHSSNSFFSSMILVKEYDNTK